MYYINYITKNEDGNAVSVRFYPDEIELRDLRAVLLQERKPMEIEFRGQILKTRNIEILDDDAVKREERKNWIDLRDESNKRMIREFEREVEEWMRANAETTFEAYLINCGAMNEDRSVIRVNLYTELRRKWSAVQELRFMRMIAERNERRSLDELAKLKGDAPIKDIPAWDEIDPQKILA